MSSQDVRGICRKEFLSTRFKETIFLKMPLQKIYNAASKAKAKAHPNAMPGVPRPPLCLAAPRRASSRLLAWRSSPRSASRSLDPPDLAYCGPGPTPYYTVAHRSQRADAARRAAARTVAPGPVGEQCRHPPHNREARRPSRWVKRLRVGRPLVTGAEPRRRDAWFDCGNLRVAP